MPISTSIIDNVLQEITSLIKMLLVQPFSAAAERVFSLLKASFGPQQDTTLNDYIIDAPIQQSLTFFTNNYSKLYIAAS